MGGRPGRQSTSINLPLPLRPAPNLLVLAPGIPSFWHPLALSRRRLGPAFATTWRARPYGIQRDGRPHAQGKLRANGRYVQRSSPHAKRAACSNMEPKRAAQKITLAHGDTKRLSSYIFPDHRQATSLFIRRRQGTEMVSSQENAVKGKSKEREERKDSRRGNKTFFYFRR